MKFLIQKHFASDDSKPCRRSYKGYVDANGAQRWLIEFADWKQFTQFLKTQKLAVLSYHADGTCRITI